MPSEEDRIKARNRVMARDVERDRDKLPVEPEDLDRAHDEAVEAEAEGIERERRA